MGDSSQAVHLTLSKGESIIIRKGSMIYITPSIEIKPIPDDPLFMGITPKETPTILGIGLTQDGKISPVKIEPYDSIIVNRKNLLAYPENIDRSKEIEFTILDEKYRLLFISSVFRENTIFVFYKGDVIQLELTEGQELLIDPENFVMAEPSIRISYIDGVRFTLLGEEPRLIKLIGPGRAWLQTITH